MDSWASNGDFHAGPSDFDIHSDSTNFDVHTQAADDCSYAGSADTGSDSAFTADGDSWSNCAGRMALPRLDSRMLGKAGYSPS